MTAPELLYRDELVELWCGDYRDGLQNMVGADAIITDPPYGRATKLAWDSWPKLWLNDAREVSRALWCFGSMAMFWERWAAFADWKYSQEIVWEKHNGSSLHADRFRRVHELAILFYRGAWADIHHEPVHTDDAVRRTVRTKRKPAHHQDAAGSRNYTSEEGGPRLMRSVIRARSEQGRAIHPTQKPLAVVQPLIEYSVPVGGLVVDFFAGSATTLVAARNTGRRAIGYEVDPKLAARAATRLSQQHFEIGAR